MGRVQFLDTHHPGGRPTTTGTWADRLSSTDPNKVTGGATTGHMSNDRLAKLENENAHMRTVIQKLMREVEELRSGNTSRMTVEATSQPRPISNEADEEIESERPTKRRALNGEQESTAAGRARSEIRQMLSALSDSVKQLTEAVAGMQSNIARLETNVASLQINTNSLQTNLAAMEERYNQRCNKIEAFLENSVAPTIGPLATSFSGITTSQPTDRVMPGSNAGIHGTPHDGRTH